MIRMPTWIRRHLPFLIIVPLLIIVITWPTVAKVFETDTIWFHTSGYDRWYKFWDAWHFKRVLAGKADFYWTDAVFHPQGLSLAFHQIAVPHVIVFGALQTFMPTANAFNLCFLLILLFNSFATHVLLLHLFGDGLISVFGAVLVGLSPQIIGGPTLPDLIIVGTIPLAVYYFHRSVTEESWKFAALSGAVSGVTALIGLYAYVCLLMTLALFGGYMALSRWKKSSFWRLILVLVAAAAVSTLRFYPMASDLTQLTEGASKYGHLTDDSYDAVDFFVNTSNPFTNPIMRDFLELKPRKALSKGYIGYVPLLLIAAGQLRKGSRRLMLPWLAMLSFFLILRLGAYLTLNGNIYPDALLPKYHFNRMLPVVFDAFGHSSRFQTGVLLPLAAASGYGLASILRGRKPAIRAGVVGVCVALAAIEYFVPISGSTLERDQLAHIEWLQSQDQDAIKLVNLPMRRDLNKYYMFLQTLNDFPQANGASNRTPSAAYTYLNENYLLNAWQRARNINCSSANTAEFTAAVDQLQDDGFTHIVFHHRLRDSGAVLPGLTTMERAYEDSHAAIFRLESVRKSCHNTRVLGPEALTPFQRLAQTEQILPDEHASILSIHPSRPVDYLNFEHYASEFTDWNSLIHIFRSDDDLAIQSLDRRYVTSADVAELNDGMLLIYDPEIIEPGGAALADSFLGEHFKRCARRLYAADAVFEFYVKRIYPCQLLFADQPLRVRYDSGIELHNLYVELNERHLDVYVLWKNVTNVFHAFSIQLFDERGEKVLGQDYVIHHWPEFTHRLDLSSLDSGEYAAKLILYNYETGVSVPGALAGTDKRFDRAVEIARLTVE